MTAIPLFYGHTGSHRKPRRARLRRSAARLRHTLAVLLAGLWERLDTAETPAPAPQRPVNGRYLGTQPRRDRAPFTEVDMPVCDEPDEHDRPHYYTDEIECEDCKREAEGDEAELLTPIARPWTADQVVYGQAPQRTVDEAERLKGLMIP